MSKQQTSGYQIHAYPTTVNSRNENHFAVRTRSGVFVEFEGLDAYDDVLGFLHDDLSDMSAYYEVLSYWGHKRNDGVNNNYAVRLNETIVHYLEVPAMNEAQAIEIARRLVENIDDNFLKRDNAYSVDSIGWESFGDAQIIP